MLKRLTEKDRLLALASEWEGVLRQAWVDSIQEITSAVVLRNLVAEIERGNVQAALEMLDIGPDRFARFERAILSAWDAGGAATVAGMPSLRDPGGNRVLFSWSVRNLPAEQALRNHAATLVDDLTTEARDVVRQTLADGLSRGRNPRQTALGLVGRVNRRSGAREGGVIGLSRPQAATLDKIYLGLRAGDAEAMRDYLGYALRDKRFDGHVRRALAEGGSVPADAVDRITTSYSNRALKYRADNLALTETNIALTKARLDAFQQQIDAGKLEAQDVVKTWGRSISREKRVDHLAMVGVSMPFNEKFTLPSGVQCDGPHDPSLPASELIGCKCIVEYRINFAAQAFRLDREDGLV